MKNRIDKYLVTSGLVPSRTKAQELIENKLVNVNGAVASKSNIMVDENDNIEILKNDKLKYVSRGGLKLEKAMTEFNIDLNDKTVMDIGSSTGGFTDCCLKHSAKKVVAIDVGTNVMVEVLRKDSRVELHENTNFRDLAHNFFENIDMYVCDVSFISLRKIIEKLVLENADIDIICLIKPQFECGKEVAKKFKGIILDKKLHFEIITDMIKFFNDNKLYVKGLTVSPIKGGDGNTEYLVYLSTKVNKNIDLNIQDVIDLK